LGVAILIRRATSASGEMSFVSELETTTQSAVTYGKTPGYGFAFNPPYELDPGYALSYG
jgi:hypothetical protein